MCDQDHFEQDREEFEAQGLVTRRQFGVMLGAGMAMMLPQVKNPVAVTESDVTVTTPDGTADCYFVHPAAGRAWRFSCGPISSLRPAFRQMGKRLAESGYSVLVVNPFYRVKKAPTAEKGAATPIPSLLPLAQALTETTQMTDARAHRVARQAEFGRDESQDRHAGLLHGRSHCVPHAAAAVSDRVGAVASFHGGGLVTDMPNSPHLQAAKTKGSFLSQSRRTTTCGRRMRRMC